MCNSYSILSEQKSTTAGIKSKKKNTNSINKETGLKKSMYNSNNASSEKFRKMLQGPETKMLC